MRDRPSIVEVISKYTELKRRGKEHVGLCPFHSEKTPSFYVNEDKETFYCHGCHEGGDVIAFIQKIEGFDFKGAIAHLGLTEKTRPTPAEIKRQQLLRETSRNLAAWALSVSEGIGTQMRELGQRAHMAQKVLKELPGANRKLLRGEIEKATRKWDILSTLEEDLLDPTQTATLWEDRETIERLVENSRTYTNEEINERFNYC